MAHVQKRGDTYQYRRVGPPRYHGHMPQVPEFPDLPNRAQFERSLGRVSKAKANARGAELDVLVDAAFEQAERRLASCASPRPSASTPPVRLIGAQPAVVLDPEIVDAAFERWLAAAKRDARIRIYNNPPPPFGGPERDARRLLVSALDRPEPWIKPPIVTDHAARAAYAKAGLDVPENSSLVASRAPHIADFDERLLSALRSQGLHVPPNHLALIISRLSVVFQAHWRDLLAAEQRYCDNNFGDDGGNDGPPVPPPPVSTAPPVSTKVDKTITMVFGLYQQERKLPPKTKADFETHLRRFTDINGDLGVRSISKDHVRAYKDAMVRFPSRMTAAMHRLTVPEVLKHFQDNETTPRLSPRTINSKAIGAIAAILNYAVNNGYCDFNPATGIKVIAKSIEDTIPCSRENPKNRSAEPQH